MSLLQLSSNPPMLYNLVMDTRPSEDFTNDFVTFGAFDYRLKYNQLPPALVSVHVIVN